MLEHHVLHLVARVCLRLAPPLRAQRAVATLGGLLRPLSIGEARRVAARLEGRGTCLSRALTLAACVPGSEIVIGGARPEGARFGAHAWVEHQGEALSATLEGHEELARVR